MVHIHPRHPRFGENANNGKICPRNGRLAKRTTLRRSQRPKGWLSRPGSPNSGAGVWVWTVPARHRAGCQGSVSGACVIAGRGYRRALCPARRTRPFNPRKPPTWFWQTHNQKEVKGHCRETGAPHAVAAMSRRRPEPAPIVLTQRPEAAEGNASGMPLDAPRPDAFAVRLSP